MGDDRWMDPTDTDAYHGQIRTLDGHLLWAGPRLHLASGWFSEVRRDGPNGELLRRRWTSTYVEAAAERGAARTAISRTDLATTLRGDRTIEEPPADVGLVVTHGPRGRRSPVDVACDDRDTAPVCCSTWLREGPHEVGWLATGRHHPDGARPERPFPILVRAGAVLHVHPPRAVLIGDRDRLDVVWYHRCRRRRLRFEGGVVRGPDGCDLRELLRP